MPPKIVLVKVCKIKRNVGGSLGTWWIHSAGGMTGQAEVDLAVKKARGTRFETPDQDLPLVRSSSATEATGLYLSGNKKAFFIVTNFYEKKNF